MKKTFPLLLLLLGLCPVMRAQLLINELMQSNIDCIMDDRNEFPDSWVELYNNTDGIVDLSAYSLGETRVAADAYALPEQQVAARGYVLVYCDKEKTGLHTDFRLESGKGACVYLFKNGVIVDSVSGLQKQPSPNIAYGRAADASSQWGYMLSPSPAAANSGLAQGVLGDPVFSTKGQVVETQQRFSLTLSVPDGSPAGTEIRYTLDGSEPTADSHLYSSTVLFNGTRTIRAKLFCPGYASPRSVTHSYITLGREMTLPVVSIVTNEAYFSDKEKGLYPNYSKNWRRPINIELFETSDTAAVINQLCETRIQGGASRECNLKSMALYANKRFGKGKFSYEFFPEDRPGKNSFKSIILRNTGNDYYYLYQRDAIIQRATARHVDLDYQAWRPAIVYINGTYKGMLNFRERTNEENIAVNYGIEDIDLIENNWDVKTGTGDQWWAFQNYYAEHGHTMADYEWWIDCKEYINLMVMNLFFNNQDFPGNNIVSWRPREATAELPARWRYIAKDTDFGLGLYNNPATYNSIAWLNNPDYDAEHAWANTWEATRLFRRLMEDDDFKREFTDRAAIYMGDWLHYDSVWAVWSPMYDAIAAEIPHHFAINTTWVNYANELSTAKQWLRQRPAQFISHVAAYYGLSTPVQMTINMALADEDAAQTDVVFNGVPLTCKQWNGKFYSQRNISVSSTSARVTGWTLSYTTSSGPFSDSWRGKKCNFSLPSDAQNVALNAVLSEPSALGDIQELPENGVKKVMRDGRILIIRDEVEYDVLGNIVR